MEKETGYSPVKTAVIWIGGLLMAAIIVTGIVLLTSEYGRQQTERMKVCFEAGNSPSECAIAVGDR